MVKSGETWSKSYASLIVRLSGQPKKKGDEEENPIELSDTPSHHSTTISEMTTVTEAIEDVLQGTAAPAKKKGQSWKRKRLVMAPAVEAHVSTVGLVPRTTAVSQRAGKLPAHAAQSGVGDNVGMEPVAPRRSTRSGTRGRSASAAGSATEADGAAAEREVRGEPSKALERAAEGNTLVDIAEEGSARGAQV